MVSKFDLRDKKSPKTTKNGRNTTLSSISEQYLIASRGWSPPFAVAGPIQGPESSFQVWGKGG